MKFYVLNGPNLNLLGIREPDIYGYDEYPALEARIRTHAATLGVEVDIFQSNHEGDLVDYIQQAYLDNPPGTVGLILNPAAYTHTSIALLDALRATSLPAVEVHISDVSKREPFRRISYIREAVMATVSGHGTDGYMEAMDLLYRHMTASASPAGSAEKGTS